MAIPLGNGQLGPLVWGRNNQLVVKLDRLDLWDERCNPLWPTPEFTWKTIHDYREAGNFDRIHAIFDRLYTRQAADAHRRRQTALDAAWGEPGDPVGTGSRPGRDTDRASGWPRRAGVRQRTTEPVIVLRLPGKPESFELWAPGKEPKWLRLSATRSR